MTLEELKYLICSDLYRYHGQVNLGIVLSELVWGIGGRYTVWFRLVSWLRGRSILWFPVYVVAKLMLRRYMFKFGIQIGDLARLGPGFFIGHFGTIVVTSRARIGRDCNISQGVTIGQSFRGERAGAPTIGDRVYIGPGAKIFGQIAVGNDVAIGANCVVTRDVPDGAVVVGIPGRIISQDGSSGYISNTDYDKILRPGMEERKGVSECRGPYAEAVDEPTRSRQGGTR